MHFLVERQQLLVILNLGRSRLSCGVRTGGYITTYEIPTTMLPNLQDGLSNIDLCCRIMRYASYVRQILQFDTSFDFQFT